MKNVMKNFKLSKRTIWIIVILLTILKVLLTFRLPISITADQMYDDQLLYNYTESILDGHWLGVYNNMTLVKGISYPIFLVICNRLMIPYTIGLSLLSIGGAAAFTQAIKKKLPNENIRYIIYLLLIYAPVHFTDLISQRSYRMAIIPDVVLLVFSFMLGMFWRKEESAKVLLPWSVGAGISLAFFWYIREDSIWIAPFVGTIMALMILYFIFILKERKKLLLKSLITLIPVGCVIMATLGIGMMNRHYYGMFTINERSGTECGKMMSYLFSVEDTNKPDDVWISHDTVEKAMSVSPTLATVRKDLEGRMKEWEQDGKKYAPIKGDLMVWVIREAVQKYGYYNDPITTNDFYRKVNQELKAAFDNGSLQKDHSLHFTSQSAGIKADKLPPLLHKSFGKMMEMSTYKECGVHDSVSSSGGFTAIRSVEALTQSYTTFRTIKDYDLNGWLFAKKDSDVLTAELVDADNNILFPIRFSDSPDVLSVYKTNKNAAKCRFHITMKDVKFKKPYLNIYLNGALILHTADLAKFNTDQFAGDVMSTMTKQKDNEVMYTKPAVDMANTIVKVYQVISPIVTILAIAGYLIMTASVIFGLRHKKYEDLDVWLGTTGVLLSAVVLMFGVEFFCSWFPDKMQKFISFYGAGVYSLVQIMKYMAIIFAIQMITKYRAHAASKDSHM